MNSEFFWLSDSKHRLKTIAGGVVLFIVSAGFVVSQQFFALFGEAGEIPHRDFPADEVGQIISPQMGVRHMNQPSVFNGFAVLAGNAIHEVWDISDPYQPQFQAEMISQHAAGEAESHQVTYGRDSVGNYYLATTSGQGVDIWNVNDIQSPIYVKAINLPGINYGDVSNAVWGVSWQGDYLFLGATNNGIYVVDVSNILQSALVKTVSVTDLGGVLAGPLFAVGNLLVVTTPKGNAGIATVDISDPLQPIVLDYEHFPPKSYIGGFYGKYATLITPFRLIDVTTDPSNIQLLHTTEVPKSEYVSFADGFLFLGGLRNGTQGIYKYDLTDPLDPELVNRVEGRDSRWDDQFSCPVGNLLIICDDQRVDGNYVGGVIGVHAERKDSIGPVVLYHLPENGASKQSIHSKIGLSLTDWIEFASVDETSFLVRAVGGEPITGSWGCTYTTLTFTPAKPLAEDTKYEVILPAGGITDLSGNPIQETFISTFTTGQETIQIGQAQLLPTSPIPLGDTANFAVGNPDLGIVYEWTTGDGGLLEGPVVNYEYQSPGRYPVSLKAFKTIEPDSIFEAEGAILSGGVTVATTHSPYSGTGYIDYPGGTGEEVKVSWELNEENSRLVSIQFSYANGGNVNRSLHLVVNNGSPWLVDFPPTGGWKVWQQISVGGINLNPGSNTIVLQATANSVGPNIDYLFLPPDPTISERRETVGSQSFIQLVYLPKMTNVPRASNSMQVVDSTLWTLNPDANTLTRIDVNTLEKLQEVSVGKHPIALAVGPDHKIWVVNRDDWSITLLDRTTGMQTGRIDLPYATQPNGLVFSTDEQSAFISLGGKGEVLKINSLTKEIEAKLSLSADTKGRIPELGALALDATRNQLLLTRFISTTGGAELFVVNAETMELVRTIPLAYDIGEDSDQFSRGIPNYLTSIALSPDGQWAWLPSKKDNIQRGTLRDGLALEHDNTVRSIVSLVDLERQEERLGNRIDLDNSDRCHSASFNQYGDLLFLTLPGNNQVAVLDAYAGKEITRLITQNAPDACVFDPQTGRLFVRNYLSRSVSAFDIRRLERSQEGIELLAEIPTVSEEPLSPEVLLGKQLFHHAGSMKLSAEGYMSCASCHLDGGQDGQTWDMSSLGEGFRNTIDLRGRAGVGEGRLHWSANFDEIHDFENQIRSLGAGTGLMAEEDFRAGTRSDPLGALKAGLSVELDALSAYMESLDTYAPSPFRAGDGSMTPEAVAGYSLFQELECYFCHAGNQYSNSSSGLRHDIGALKETSGQRRASNLLGIDVPGLRTI
ncbi:MAG: Ig-like domain-containing protein, partial [Saprospiraceae bacterium]|nr:Ig-like domain-containing protein [Saprospiraceae bacterium]